MMTTKRAFLGEVRLLGQAGAAPQEIGDAGFAQALSAPKAVVMFFSPNCPYSQHFLPIYQAVGPQTPGIFFATVNVDQGVQNAGKYQVRMLPTVVFLMAGKEVGRIDGVQDQGDFLTTMNQSFGGGGAAAAPSTTVNAQANTAGCPIVTTPPATASPWIWGLGAAGVTGALGAAAYFLFRK